MPATATVPKTQPKSAERSAHDALAATQQLVRDLDAERDRADWLENHVREIAAAAGLPVAGNVRTIATVVRETVKSLRQRVAQLEATLLDHARHKPAPSEIPAPSAHPELFILTSESAHCRACDCPIPADHVVREPLAGEEIAEQLSAYCPTCRKVYRVNRVLAGGVWAQSGPVAVLTAGPEFARIKGHVEQLDGTLRYTDEDSQVDPNERLEKAAVLSRDDRFAPV
jgi:hypothetical protein